MAKAPTLTTISSGYASQTQLNGNFDAIETAFTNTLSLDGSTPNAMGADLDLNGNDLINGGTLYGTSISVGGIDLTTVVTEAADSATAAATSAAAALISETNAAASEAYVASVEASLPDWQGEWLTATAYETGDLVRFDGSVYICLVAHTSGTFSTDLSSLYWELFAQKGAAGAGDMLSTNNLSDVANPATSLANIGGQPLDATLTSLSSLGTVADRLAYTTALDTWAETPITTAGRALIDDASASDQRTTLGLGSAAVATLIDDDTFATATASNIPSAESTKAYVDSANQVRAWVNFNGTGTVAIRASYGVSSITDNGTGDYTVNFTGTFVDADYAAAGNAGLTSSPLPRGPFIASKTTTNCNARTYNISSGAAYDVDICDIIITR